MGVREGQGMALNSLPLAQLIEALPLVGESLSGLAKWVDRQLRISFGQATAGIEPSLLGPRFLLRRSLRCCSGSHHSLADYPWPGGTAFQWHESVAPLHPPTAIQPPL